MAGKARKAGVHFRPHFKTHQSTIIGEWFRDEGVQAITVSSLDMAEYFARAGWDDITLAFSVNLRQMDGLNALGRRIHLGLLVESLESVDALAQRIQSPVDLWIKVDSGAHRTGLSPDNVDLFIALASRAQASPHLRLSGLLTHAGHTYAAGGPQPIVAAYQSSLSSLLSLRDQLAAHGLTGLSISVGDTPGCTLSDDLGPVDEIRPGNFTFFDAQQLTAGVCAWQNVAVALACPVVALHPERSEAVVYGGAIHLSKDSCRVGSQVSYGLVCLPEGPRWSAPVAGAWVDRLSQEHGILHLPAPTLAALRVGDLVCILPAHSCLTAQCMGAYLTLQGHPIAMMPNPYRNLE
ncbi:MAG: alanine racemase, partial [Anaerolineae bacterium]|nr:alanine racemase [Anaerolineae bacterium]